ncbi:MAG: hypothetical protein ACRDO7_08075, partial [Nocardioidaceae bacterium]
VLKKELDDIIKILPVKVTKLGQAADFGPLGGVIPCSIGADVTMPAVPGVRGYESPQTFYNGVHLSSAYDERCNG